MKGIHYPSVVVLKCCVMNFDRVCSDVALVISSWMAAVCCLVRHSSLSNHYTARTVPVNWVYALLHDVALGLHKTISRIVNEARVPEI